MENQKKQQEEKAERERILRLIEENKRMEQEQKKRIKENSLKYQQGETNLMLLYRYRLIKVVRWSYMSE